MRAKNIDYSPQPQEKTEKNSLSDELTALKKTEREIRELYKNKKEVELNQVLSELEETKKTTKNYLIGLYLDKILKDYKYGIPIEEAVESERNLVKLAPDLVGVFDKNGQLSKICFIKANKMYSGLPSDLFTYLKKNSIDGGLEENKDDFLFLSHSFFHYHLDKKFDIKLENLSLPEQFWFIDFLKDGNERKIERLKAFVAQFGEEGIKTFLAMEHDKKNGELILNIGEKMDKKTASAIFSKFNEIASLIKDSDAELSNKFFAHKKQPVSPAAEILKRAQDILKNFAPQEKENPSKETTTESGDNKILEELNKIKQESVFFASMFKTAFENFGGLDFKEIKDLNFELKNSSEISDEEKEQIMTLAEETYSQKSDIKKIVIHGLEESFNNKKTKWYLLKKENQVVATMRFDNKGEQLLYAGSFMVKPELSGSSIGQAFEQNSLDKEAQKNKIIAIAEALGRPIAHYVEKDGWIITNFKIDEQNNIPLFEIVRDDEINKKYQSRELEMTPEKIAELWEKQQKTNPRDWLKESIFVFKFSATPDDFDLRQIKTILNNDFVITRFVRGEKFGNELYCAFEKNKNVFAQKTKKEKNLATA